MVVTHTCTICDNVHPVYTFNISSDGIEAGDPVGCRRVAPEDVVLWINAHTTVGKILLPFTVNSIYKDWGGGNQLTLLHILSKVSKFYLVALSSFLSIIMRPDSRGFPSLAVGTRPKRKPWYMYTQKENEFNVCREFSVAPNEGRFSSWQLHLSKVNFLPWEVVKKRKKSSHQAVHSPTWACGKGYAPIIVPFCILHTYYLRVAEYFAAANPHLRHKWFIHRNERLVAPGSNPHRLSMISKPGHGLWYHVPRVVVFLLSLTPKLSFLVLAKGVDLTRL